MERSVWQLNYSLNIHPDLALFYFDSITFERVQLPSQMLQIFGINIAGKVVLAGTAIVLKMMEWAVYQRTPEHSAIQRIQLVRTKPRERINRAFEIYQQDRSEIKRVVSCLPRWNFLHPG